MWIASWAGVAEAQPSDRFPDHTTIIFEGERYEGFDLGGFSELLRMDADLVAASRTIANLESQVRSLSAAASSLQRAVEEGMEQVEALQAERDRLLESWTEENRLRLEAENEPDIFGVAGWVLAASFTVVTLILGGVLAIGGSG